METSYSFQDFEKIIDRLMGENGCPWDRKQTHQSLRQNMLEEAYEAVDAIEKNDIKGLCEELGDCLLQVVLHGKIAEKDNEFTIADIIDGVSKKMIFRHRHIFGEETADNAEEAKDVWEKAKRDEKGIQTNAEALRSVPANFPALFKMYKLLKKLESSGMNLGDIQQDQRKISEILDDVPMLREKTQQEKERIMGKLFMHIVNLSRILQINPEIALTNAAETFINNLEYIENASLSQGNGLQNLSIYDLEVL